MRKTAKTIQNNPGLVASHIISQLLVLGADCTIWPRVDAGIAKRVACFAAMATAHSLTFMGVNLLAKYCVANTQKKNVSASPQQKEEESNKTAGATPAVPAP